MDVLQLNNKMQKYHMRAKGIPEYINMFEDVQKATLRINTQNPITDTTLLSIATSATFTTQQYARTND